MENHSLVPTPEYKQTHGALIDSQHCLRTSFLSLITRDRDRISGISAGQWHQTIITWPTLYQQINSSNSIFFRQLFRLLESPLANLQDSLRQ
jgi:hypothetical protein